MQLINPQSSSAIAAQRFYAAFYQWAVLTSTSCWHHGISKSTLRVRQYNTCLSVRAIHLNSCRRHFTKRSYSTSTTERRLKLEPKLAARIETNGSSRHRVLTPDISARFPSEHFRSPRSYAYFQILCRCGFSALLQPIASTNTSLDKEFFTGQEAHSVFQIDTDFLKFWIGAGAELVEKIEQQTGSQIKLADCASVGQAFVALTGDLHATHKARHILTREYAKTPTDAYQKNPSVGQQTELEVEISRKLFPIVIGAFGRFLSRWRRMASSSVTTDLKATQDGNYTIKVRGPINIANIIKKEMKDREFNVDEKRRLAESQNRFKRPKPGKIGSGDEHGDEIRKEHLPDGMRLLMRRMIHPIVLITATKSDEKDAKLPATLTSADIENFCAMTVSSMTTVTLTPKPVISFNAKRPSRTLEAILSQKSFFTTLLAENQNGACIADAFARGSPQAGLRRIEKLDTSISFQPDSVSFPPKISSTGFLGRFACELIPEKCVDIADHTIVVAKVVGIEVFNKKDYGLSYTNGRYRRVGDGHSLDKSSDKIEPELPKAEHIHVDNSSVAGSNSQQIDEVDFLQAATHLK